MAWKSLHETKHIRCLLVVDTVLFVFLKKGFRFGSFLSEKTEYLFVQNVSCRFLKQESSIRKNSRPHSEAILKYCFLPWKSKLILFWRQHIRSRFWCKFFLHLKKKKKMLEVFWLFTHSYQTTLHPLYLFAISFPPPPPPAKGIKTRRCIHPQSLCLSLGTRSIT